MSDHIDLAWRRLVFCKWRNVSRNGYVQSYSKTQHSLFDDIPRPVESGKEIVRSSCTVFRLMLVEIPSLEISSAAHHFVIRCQGHKQLYSPEFTFLMSLDRTTMSLKTRSVVGYHAANVRSDSFHHPTNSSHTKLVHHTIPRKHTACSRYACSRMSLWPAYDQRSFRKTYI